MKLLLTSGGVTNDSILNALKELAEKPLSKLKLAFIPTAANVEAGDKWWFLEDLQRCQRLGFKEIDIVDISAIPQTLWLPRLQAADVILVEGGNTFYLLHWVKKSGLARLLPDLLKNKVYVGVSAGTIILTPSLALSASEKEILIELNEPVDYHGLSLVNFLVEPHVNSKYFPELTFENAATQAKKLKKTVYAIDDATALKVVDGKVHVVSEGEWEKF